MFSKNKRKLASIAISAVVLGVPAVWAAPDALTSVNAASLPINVANQANPSVSAKQDTAPNALVSPSKAKTGMENAKLKEAAAAPKAEATAKAAQTTAATQATVPAQPVAVSQPAQDDFSFDLKMKSANPTVQSKNETAETGASVKNNGATISDADLPKDIQYKANPVEALGNSVLSQMDSDLFSQMSEIEKSTTLLTLELRREKIRNEIEAQKAIRQKNLDDLERQRAEERLKDLERKKKIEAQVIQEKQALLDKEKIFEILKQRKLLNAYMNQMLVNQQEWLKEKESLYAQIAAVEQEKKELVELFKQRIDKVLEASAKNIQVAEAARANFERIVKNLKARNEQLRKRVEADAQIIKNAKNSLFLKSQSIDELKDKNAANAAVLTANNNAVSTINLETSTDEEVEEEASKLSAKYAILGISGAAGNMSVEIIDVDGQPISLKVGSPLPSGHIVSEIGSDYVKFNRDGSDDYLYVGRSIDGFVPTLGLTDEKDKK